MGNSSDNNVYKNYIDGKWVATPDTFGIINPATEDIVAEAPNGTREDMKMAIAAARRAFDKGPWRQTTPQDRSKILHRIADLLHERRREFRKLLIETHGCEWVTHYINLKMPVQLLRYYADLALRFEFDQMLPLGTAPTQNGTMAVSSMVHRQPVGVCGLIPTWNFPLYVTVQKFGPLIAAGCTGVTKPSPFGPLVDLLFAELVEEAGVPAGVYNVVAGESPDLGIELAESPSIDKISFTGSVETGKRIMSSAAATLKRVHLELGGKSANLILDDWNLNEAAPYAASPAFFHAGQGCAMNTRVLVSRARHDELVEKMSVFVQAFVQIGDPNDKSVMLGPLIREERRAAVEKYISTGKADGARLVCGGRRPEHLKKGYFLEPTIFSNVTNDMRIATDEIFGPVVSVIPYDSVEEAVQIANDSSFGLFGGILTKDTARAIEIAKQIRTGGVSIGGALNLLEAPFGGFKQSGIGRECGEFGLHEYLEVQAISWGSGG
ncbi:MAG: aldehyde dehydrogenase family protein [Polyangiaceae bacterium]|nr:aldehyde dehydrogenase family protein [Polyangiaceae bacterium]